MWSLETPLSGAHSRQVAPVITKPTLNRKRESPCYFESLLEK
jgi:hypothetical protein